MPLAASRRSQREILATGRREQIVEAAREVIGRDGYEQTSVDQIAEEAGLAKSTIYVYFDSKEEILKHSFAVGHAQLRRRIGGELSSATSAEEALSALATALLKHVDDNRAFFRAIASLAFQHATQETPAEMIELESDVGKALEEAIRRGIASGELHTQDPRESALLFATLLFGAVALRARQSRPEAPGRLGQRLACTFVHGIAAP